MVDENLSVKCRKLYLSCEHSLQAGVDRGKHSPQTMLQQGQQQGKAVAIPGKHIMIITMETYNAPSLALKAQHKALTKTGNKLKEMTLKTKRTVLQSLHLRLPITISKSCQK